METTWTVLRRFGYGEGLELNEEVLAPRSADIFGGREEVERGLMRVEALWEQV